MACSYGRMRIRMGPSTFPQGIPMGASQMAMGLTILKPCLPLQSLSLRTRALESTVAQGDLSLTRRPVTGIPVSRQQDMCAEYVCIAAFMSHKNSKIIAAVDNFVRTLVSLAPER